MTYNLERLEHVLSDVFEFLNFERLIDSVDNVVICLLLLLFHLRKLLEAFLTKITNNRV